MSESKPSEPQPTTPPSQAQSSESKTFAAFKAFWSSFPGILTAIGGLIAALAALISSLDKAALLRRETPTPPPTAIVTQAHPLTLTLAPSPSPNPTATAAPSSTPVAVVTPSPAATLPPATPTAVQLPEGTLLVDDFGSAGGWDVGADPDYMIGYEDGEYRVVVRGSGLFIWGNPKRSYDLSDFSIEVDVRRVDGPVDIPMSLVVRRRDDRNFYQFSIASDGTCGVDMLQNDNWNSLIEWAASESVKQGTEWNHLRVECVGPRMRFYVNNDLIADFEDNTFASGNVGLGAGPVDEGSAEVRFDNVRVQVLTHF